MRHLLPRLTRTAAIATLAVTLAACGGGRSVATSTGHPIATDPTPSEAASPVETRPAPALQTAAPSLDLPDLSGAEGLLTDIDGVLANDASAPADEGSDK